MSEHLLPCPFCGGDDVSVFGPVGWHRNYGISHSCGVFYSGVGDFTVGAHSKAQAVAAWNRRAPAATATPARDDLRDLLARVPSALNSAFGAGIEEREGGSARRQAKMMEPVDKLRADIVAALRDAGGTDGAS